jgi:CheY-like chemotaxis protein/PAS domain-containing protein
MMDDSMDLSSAFPPLFLRWFGASADAQLLIDSGGAILSMNPAAEALLLNAHHPEKPNSVYQLFDRETGADFFNAVDYLLKSAERISTRGDLRTGQAVEITLIPLADSPSSPEGGIFILMSIRDLSYLHTLEQDLHQIRQQANALLENSPLSYVWLDSIGTVLDASERYVSGFFSLESSRENLRGKTFINTIRCCPAEIGSIMLRVMRGEKCRYENVEWKLDEDQERFCIDLQGIPLFGSLGEVCGCVLIFTESNSGAAMSEANFRKAQEIETMKFLLEGLLQDFNSRMQSIISRSGHIHADDRISDALRQNAQAIEDASLAAVGITDELLRLLSRPVFTRQMLNLNDIARRCAAILHSSLAGKIAFSLELDSAELFFEADEGSAMRALMTVCLKAVKSMPNGGTIRLRSGKVSASEARNLGLETALDGAVWVAVKDQGPGLNAEHADIDPLRAGSQVVPSTAKISRDLEVSRYEVRKHGGILNMESQIGRGTTYALYFPAAAAKTAGAAGTAEAVDEPREVILLVEDEELLGGVSQEILELEGFRVIRAESGAQAVKLYRQQKVALVIMDFMLPDKDEINALEEIRKIDPQARILLTSGYTTESGIWKILEDGTIKFIQKPYRAKELLLKVKSIIGDKKNAN